MAFNKVVFEQDRLKVVSNEKGWLRVVNKAATSGAAILGVLPSGKFLLVREEREEISGPRLIWNIPRGAGDPHESSKDAAIREFVEETGILAPPERFFKLGVLAPDNGILLSTVDLYGVVLHGVQLPEELKGQDELEIKGVRGFTKDELLEMAVQGELTDSFTLAALPLWEKFCRQHELSSSGTKNIHVSLHRERYPRFHEALTTHAETLRSLGGIVGLTSEFAKLAISWTPWSAEAPAIEACLKECYLLSPDDDVDD